jgi:hypothetical protein
MASPASATATSTPSRSIVATRPTSSASCRPAVEGPRRHGADGPGRGTVRPDDPRGRGRRVPVTAAVRVGLAGGRGGVRPVRAHPARRGAGADAGLVARGGGPLEGRLRVRGRRRPPDEPLPGAPRVSARAPRGPPGPAAVASRRRS